jgi:small conductance mechanosensitive channel
MQLTDIWWPLVDLLVSYSPIILAALVMLTIGWFLSNFAARAVRRVLPRNNGVYKNFAPLLSQVASYGIMLVAIITALSILGVPSNSILTVLGAAGLAIALALQGTLSNIAAGIMLIWLRPIAIGEYITSGAVSGVVVEIGLFGTRLRSTSGLYIFAPNQIIWSSAITNHSREPQRRVDISAAFPDTVDLAHAREIMLRIGKADQRVLADPPPSVHVESFSGDTANLQLRAWVATPNYQPALYDLREAAKRALVNELRATAAEKSQIHVVAQPEMPQHTLEPPRTE